nr:hypothetical protein [uncultured Halomonas sp.]
MQANNEMNVKKHHPLNLYGWAYALACEHGVPEGQSGLSREGEDKLRHGLVIAALGIHVAAIGLMFYAGATWGLIGFSMLVALLPGLLVAVPAIWQEGQVGLLKRHLCAMAVIGLYAAVAAKVLNLLVFSVFGPALMLMLESSMAV